MIGTFNLHLTDGNNAAERLHKADNSERLVLELRLN